jgi:ABC-type sugar transport system ATPase subunit
MSFLLDTDVSSAQKVKPWPRIELRQLAKTFSGGIEALKPVDLSIADGELLVVLGPSGSGKSTLLRVIAGLERASAGSVWFDGRNVGRVPPHRRNVAMVFQNPVLFPHLSVIDNLAFGLRARRVSRDQVQNQIHSVAGMLGLERLLARRPGALSGGERQRVAIGRALVRQPRLVLFDEPFSNLDSPLRTALREQVIDFHRRMGTTLIHVTHDQSEAMLMGHRVLVLDRGLALQCGTPQAVYDQPAHRFVAAFIGSPPMNLLPCQIKSDGGASYIHPVGTDASLRWPVARESLPRGWAGATRLFDLGFRPESILVREPGGVSESPARSARLSAMVRTVEFTGPALLATLAVGPHRLIARLPRGQTIHESQRVEVVVDLARAVWFDQPSGLAVERG